MRTVTRTLLPALLLLVMVVAGCTPVPTASHLTTPEPAPAGAGSAVPRPDHVVVVMLENKHRTGVIGRPDAPFLNSLAAQGANMAQSYGVTHPSQPNYLALFSGSLQGVTSNDCPNTLRGDNLGHQVLQAGLSFVGYSESLPHAGYTGCESGRYRRKHNSWVNFSNLPSSVNQPFSAFPDDFDTLPTVAFVTPNMCSDMHDCPVSTGDAWMKTHLGPYATWARSHNSLLVVTFDENAGGTLNQIATILVGQMVRPGTYGEQMNHYTLLRTIEDAYGLPALGNAAPASPLQSVWTTSPPGVEQPAGVANPSFELGLAGWATSGSATTTRSSRHGGSLVARAGKSKASKGDSVISQTIVAPAGTSRLSVNWLGRCSDKASKAWATIIVKRNTSKKISTLLPRTCVRKGSWKRVSVKVTPGHSYTIRLVNHDDGKASTPNRTYFDDVTLY